MIAQVYVDAIGFSGPGIESLSALTDAMGGAAIEVPQDWQPSPELLPKRQARRLSGETRVAMMAAEQIAPALQSDDAWVFASSSGEGDTLGVILTALCEPDIMLQPVKFQNAVHNAAQGQVSIAVGSTGAATSIAAFDNSVAAGLLKAAMQIRSEETACGLVAFDKPLPPPLQERRPYELTLAGALALSPTRTERSLACIDIGYGRGLAATDPGELPGPRHVIDSNNPVRFLLPVIAAIAGKTNGSVVLDLAGGGQLCLEVAVLSDA